MKIVELHTYQKSKIDKGYGIKHGLIGATVMASGGYSKLASVARRLSKHIGEEIVDGMHYPEMTRREKGLAAVAIITSEQDSEQTSETWDFFENGKYSYTIKEIWRKGGGYTKNKYISDYGNGKRTDRTVRADVEKRVSRQADI